MARRSKDVVDGGVVDGPSARSAVSSYINTEDAARLLQLSPRTLERLRANGTGPRYYKRGKGVRARVLYRSTDIEAWLEQSPFMSTSEYEVSK